MVSFATLPGGQGNTLCIHKPPALTQSTGCFPIDSEIIYFMLKYKNNTQSEQFRNLIAKIVEKDKIDISHFTGLVHVR